MDVSDRTVIVICGPTAVGKTSLAIQLAEHYDTDIISADSRQCYKELNIGVAKPSAKELETIKHYFINSHSINDEVNAGVFEKYSVQASNEIFERKKYAVMVGGTGLYIRAFTQGIDEIPSASNAVRQQLNNKYQQRGLSWLQQEVRMADPAFWVIAEQQNPHRLLRALEVLQTTGKSITEFRKGNNAHRDFKTIKIGLQLPKEALYHNINTRVEQMIEQGLVDEVNQLLPLQHLTALQTVGYRELFEHFAGRASIETAISNIKTNTRHYAKRQMTWFKKDPQIRWNTVGPNSLPEIIELIRTEKNNNDVEAF
jgi:tRNA dimethylallyltransferase